MNQSYLRNSEKLSFSEPDQKSAKQISKDAVIDSEVILVKHEKYKTEKYNTKNTTQMYTKRS